MTFSLQGLIILGMIQAFIIFTILVSCSKIEITPLNGQSNDKQKSAKSRATKPNAFKDEPKKSEVLIVKSTPKNITHTQAVKSYCQKTDKYFAKYNWGKSGCESFKWNHVRSSFWGNPILWHVIGEEESVKTEPERTTMILCGVHGDEITPVKFCYDLLNDLKTKPDITEGNLVIIAPLVTPDSFFRATPTRTNARGVDANRNFPTKDWNKNALKVWKQRYKSDKRRYPGKKAMSEQETYFQVNLIKRYKPAKIISVHAPLTLIDYDGPNNKDHEGAHQLLIQMSDKAGKYRTYNYPFFPGSLGNWAGNERKIPTYTLELPNSDWNKTKKFYETFKGAIYHAIEQSFDSVTEGKEQVSDTEENKPENDKVL